MPELLRKRTVDVGVFVEKSIPKISQHQKHHKCNKKEGENVFREGLAFIIG
jgi:hypothetical protein